MSRENLEVVRRIFEAWNDGSLEDVVPLVDEGIEWLEVEGLPALSGEELRGRDVVRSALESLFETWQQYRLEPEEVRAVGNDRVLAILREIARGRVSGAEVTSRWGYVMTVRDGKVARVEAYRDPSQALAAVGLRE